MIERILSVYHRATDEVRASGMVWYESAHVYCQGLADEYRIHLDQACAVVAVLSPGGDWQQNMLNALNVIKHYQHGGTAPKCATYPSNVRKAYALLQLDFEYIATYELQKIVRGPKVWAFYRLLRSPHAPHSTVCVDRHAVRLATGLTEYECKLILNRKNGYFQIAAEYVGAADKVGILPHQMQAITWLQHKLEGDHRRKKGIQASFSMTKNLKGA